ncbi:multicopper oxidases [Moesziomyces antarcticus T-34]|uniref:Multicopper oxidases n=1 Tax=Pseudozyma antarctica (strain T-34) TaxID=1151754 RepID=M9MC90_PSEA3|nr:multicopper oxidases [Moesziomyces antarcticus T-34]
MVRATTSAALPAVALLACSLASLIPAASAATVEHHWNINWIPDVNPDGLLPRHVIGVNGTWPPPIINVNASDTLRVTATNNLNTGVGTSLHSHGMFFNRTGYFDGAVAITQCPIPPGESFTYETLNSPASPADRRKQMGTFWIHAHNNDQYTDGLRSPVIIHPDDPADMHYSYDDDYTVILGDWYHSNYTDLVKNEFMNRKNPTGAEPVPKSGLIYFAHTPNTTTAATYLPGFSENATLPFEAGKTYRLRVINMSALAAFYFYLSGHDMQVIEIEGVDVEPRSVDFLSLAVAQRFSVLVKARNDTSPQNWKLHANMDEDMFDVVPEDLQLNVTATISYPNAPKGEFGPEKIIEEYTYFDDLQFTPVNAEPMVQPDATHRLDVSFDTMSDGENYAAFNNISYVAPKVPALFTSESMGALASNPAIYGPNANAFVFQHNDMIEVQLFNWDAGKHPFHLHGHHFQVVHKSQDVTSDDPTINPPFNASQVNPMRRDTVVVPPGGSAYLRFRADNPGAWFFHCHIDPHLVSGLASIFIEAPDVLSNDYLNVPSYIKNQCQAQGIATTGNAVGLNSTTDFQGLQKGPTYLESGWTGRAIAAFTGCIVTGLLGLATVVVYGWHSGEDEDVDDDEDDK